MKKSIALILFLVLLAAGALAAWQALRTQSDLIQQARERVGLAASGAGQDIPLATSGILEARTVAVSSELGGRILALHVAEGDEVIPSQPLLTLDDSLLRPGIDRVEAAVAVAQAQLDLLQAGARPEQLHLAQTQLAQAEAAVTAAQQAWDDVRLLRDTQQDLDVQIVEAETAAVKAGHQATAARRLAEAADLQAALWGRVTELLQQGVDVPLPTGGVLHVDNPAERDRANTQWNLSSQQAWEAWQMAYAAEDAAQTCAAPAPNLLPPTPKSTRRRQPTTARSLLSSRRARPWWDYRTERGPRRSHWRNRLCNRHVPPGNRWRCSWPRCRSARLTPAW
jgi:multidrug efflux pump subunit AcrA (membrane-fusion protein)